MDGEKITIEASELKALLDKNDQQEKDIRTLYDGSIKVMELMGLAENGNIKAECFEPGANPLPDIISGAGEIFGLVTRAGAPFGMGKTAEKKLMEKFGFFKDLIPLFEKYGKQFNS